MTKEEARQHVEAYSAQKRRTHENVYEAFRRARQKKELSGSTERVTREEVRQELPSKSTGTVSAYMWAIEALEYGGDGPKAQPQSEGPQKPLPPVIEQRMAAARAALEAIPVTITEAYADIATEQSSHWQELLDQQRAATEAERSAGRARIADLEQACRAAGEEVEEAASRADLLYGAMQASEDECAAAIEHAKALSASQAILSDRLATAEAQITAYARTEQLFSDEVERYRAEREGMIRNAERADKFKVEVDRLQLRLEAEAAHYRALTDEIRAAHAREIATLRNDLTAQVDAQTRRAEFLESGVLGALDTAVKALDREVSKS